MAETKAKNELAKYTGGNLIARKRKVVKKAIVGNMAGTGRDSGLIHKSLRVINQWLDSDDPELQKDALDKIVKLLPYAVDKEAVSDPVKDKGAKTVNVQINSFSDFINDRVSRTNLGELIGGIVKKQEEEEQSEEAEVEEVDEDE